MCLAPPFKGFLLAGVLVTSVAYDVQEFQRRHPPYVIPCAAARLADEVYIGNPSPAVIESAFRICASFAVTSVFAGPSGILAASVSE